MIFRKCLIAIKKENKVEIIVAKYVNKVEIIVAKCVNTVEIIVAKYMCRNRIEGERKITQKKRKEKRKEAQKKNVLLKRKRNEQATPSCFCHRQRSITHTSSKDQIFFVSFILRNDFSS
jgi:hypothetical protein